MAWGIAAIVGGVIVTGLMAQLIRWDRRRPSSPDETNLRRMARRSWTFRLWVLLLAGPAFVAVGIGVIVRDVNGNPLWGVTPPYTVIVESRCDTPLPISLTDDANEPGVAETLPPRSFVELRSDGRVDDDATDDVLEIRFDATSLPAVTIGSTSYRLNVTSSRTFSVRDLDFRRRDGRWTATVAVSGTDCGN